jgi:ATP-dependent RNA circularization protein (DNA/RNA ligase family)
MIEYPKIETLFERDERFVVDPTRLKKPVLGTINLWDVTEKIDGTNVRVMMDTSGKVTFGGRTDNAQMPTGLLQQLMETFTTEKMIFAFSQPNQPQVCAILFGEGYGAGIQKGGCYRPDKSFRLFDVLVDEKWWLDWLDVCDVADKLGIKTVPYLGQWTLAEIVERVKPGIRSVVAEQEAPMVNEVKAEGIVARPIQALFDKRGERIIIKLKTKDFIGGKR